MNTHMHKLQLDVHKTIIEHAAACYYVGIHTCTHKHTIASKDLLLIFYYYTIILHSSTVSLLSFIENIVALELNYT